MKRKKERSLAEEFLYGEVNGHKTTPAQEKYLHIHGIEHGHIFELPSGKRVKREVS